jgi:hypothetical protein
MKEIDYKLLFLEGLAEPDYSRVEFWAKQQPESGYSRGVFWMKLNDWFNHYNQKIKLDIESQSTLGNNVSDCAYPLFIETKGKLVGLIGKGELTKLGISLHLLGKKWELGKHDDTLIFGRIN